MPTAPKAMPYVLTHVVHFVHAVKTAAETTLCGTDVGGVPPGTSLSDRSMSMRSRASFAKKAAYESRRTLRSQQRMHATHFRSKRKSQRSAQLLCAIIIFFSEMVGKINDAEKALAGAFAGGVSRMVVAPLDVIKIRLQTDSARHYKSFGDVVSGLWMEEGVVSFWRGNTPALLMYTGYGACQFALYAPMRSLLAAGCDATGSNSAQTSAGLSFASGAACGTAATAMTYPLDVLRTRFAAQGVPAAHRSPRAMARAIVAREGVRSLFTGFAPAIAAIGPNIGISFAAYDVLASLASGGDGSGSELAGRGAPSLSPLGSAAIGCVSGFLAKVLTYPLDTIKKRMQVASLVRSWAAGGGAGESAGGGAAAQRSVAAQREKRGGFATLRVLLRTEGPAALFRGLSASLAKQVPAVGSAFFVFGEAKRWLAARHE